MSAPAAHCVVCKEPVTPATGIGFRVGRYVLAACNVHAPPVRDALYGARQIALSSVRTAMQKKTPELFVAGQKAWQVYSAVRAQLEPR